MKYVLVYALKTVNGGVLIDAGWDAPESFEALLGGLEEARLRLEDVNGVVATHFHPDHYGLTGRIREASGAWIALHPADASLVRRSFAEVDALLERTAVWLAATGAPHEETQELLRDGPTIRQLTRGPAPDLLIEDGHRLDIPGWHLLAIHTPGHSPGHLCFYDEPRDLLFAGDHVLPRITPNISHQSTSTANPLRDFLNSLDCLRSLAHALVLPAHEARFTNLTARLDELLQHHQERLARVNQLVAEGSNTVWEIAVHLTWSGVWQEMPPWIRRSAMGEAHAHLILLESQGRVQSAGLRPIRWRPLGRSHHLANIPG